MTLIEQLNSGIKEAMKNRNQLRLDTLRMLKSKILVVDARAELADTEVLKLFKAYLGSLQEALEQSKSRPEIAEQLKSEILIVQEFLPQGLSQEETEKLVKQAIATSGAKQKKDLGLVMKAVMALNSSVDGKLASSLALKQLD